MTVQSLWTGLISSYNLNACSRKIKTREIMYTFVSPRFTVVSSPGSGMSRSAKVF